MKSSISPTAYALLSQIALTGEFPADAVPRLIPHAAYAAKIVSALKKDKLIRAYRRGQLCTLRLSAVGRAFLLADAPDRFGPLLHALAPYKTELHHRSRRCQMAQLALTMRSAGVAIFPDEKPPLSALSLQTLRLPAYYSSLEIKGMGIEGTKIKNARFCGVLLTENKCLLCYHAGDGSLRWTRQSELKSRALLTHLFCRQLLPGRYTVGDVQALMQGACMDRAATLLDPSPQHDPRRFRLDEVYEHFHFCSEAPGEAFILLTLLLQPNVAHRLRQTLAAGLRPPSPTLNMEHDGFLPDGTPVLFVFDADMQRFDRYVRALLLYGRSGCGYCFDFQKEAFIRRAGAQIQWRTISTQRFWQYFGTGGTALHE